MGTEAQKTQQRLTKCNDGRIIPDIFVKSFRKSARLVVKTCSGAWALALDVFFLGVSLALSWRVVHAGFGKFIETVAAATV